MPPAAPIVSSEPTTLAFSETGRLDCVYVEVDIRGRPDVANFLSTWNRCCNVARVDWQQVRRPAAALVGIELGHDCRDDAPRMRLVFDVRRDRGVLDHLCVTEALVVGSKKYGGLGNSIAAYGVDADAVEAAIAAALAALAEQPASSP